MYSALHGISACDGSSPGDAGSQARAPAHGKTGAVFCEFAYRTKKSWSRTRRVIAKAEQIEGKENPRYLVTALDKEAWSAQKLYEQLYCARGEMENRIKEQLSLFADRMSTETLRANQLRLYFSSLAYVLVEALRRLGLAGTEWAEAQADTIRLKLLKIAAQVRITARRIWVRTVAPIPGRRFSPRPGRRCAAEKEERINLVAHSQKRSKSA